jgi:hypothetical protein
LTQQTKDEAREESLRRWHALPSEDRQTLEQAQIFAAALAAELHFRTMSNTRKVILSWLVRDLDGLPAWGNVPPESVISSQQEAAEQAISEATENEDILFDGEVEEILPEDDDEIVDEEELEEFAALDGTDQDGESTGDDQPGSGQLEEAHNDNDHEDTAHRHAAE